MKEQDNQAILITDHYNKFKWFPKYVYLPMLYIEAHNEECCYAVGFSNSDACQGISLTLNGSCILNYEEPPINNGNVITVYEFVRSIPDPNNSRDSSYCTKIANYESTQGQSAQCPPGQIKITNPLDLVEVTCYNGPKILVKGIVQTYYFGGRAGAGCGTEKYYYAKDLNDPSITWGYVYYEYFPATNINCDNYSPCNSSGNWNCYKNEIFSTKYYPDLKPYIPNSAIEKH